MKRNLDGIYFRVKEDGKCGNTCFSDLTEEQMNYVLQGKNEEWLKSMCILLGKTIRGIGDSLNISSGDDGE